MTEKKLKKVAYLSEAAFRKLLSGESLDAVWCQAEKLHDGRVLYLPSEAGHLPNNIQKEGQPIWTVERRPQVTIDRAASAAALFHTGRTVFNAESGLWFALRWINKPAEIASQVEAAFLELGDAGLGGERSRGFGNCTIASSGRLELTDVTQEQPWITLSRYLPKNQVEAKAMSDSRSAYAISSVGGWVTTPQRAAQRRKIVNMLSEGSVLGSLVNDPPGQMVDVRPVYQNEKPPPEEIIPLTHPVWRNGFALAIGMPE